MRSLREFLNSETEVKMIAKPKSTFPKEKKTAEEKSRQEIEVSAQLFVRGLRNFITESKHSTSSSPGELKDDCHLRMLAARAFKSENPDAKTIEDSEIGSCSVLLGRSWAKR